MKILLQYLKPYKWLVVLTLSLAAINIGFSLVDPILLGKLINLANSHQGGKLPSEHNFDNNRFFNSFSWEATGVWFITYLFYFRSDDQPYRKKFPGLFFKCGHPEIWRKGFYRWLATCDEITLPAV